SAPRRRQRDPQWDSKLCEVLRGEFEQTSKGELFVARRRHPVAEPYGRSNLTCCLSMPIEPLNALYQGLEGFDMQDTLFFDTETTGLAGGSGTYAFLVGLGYYSGQEFVTEQLLMRDHSDEPALLAYLSRLLHYKSSLVSFNGRSFDAQLLTTRYGMHRLQDPFGDRAHLDLLHISRRLWGLGRLPDCRLETLEARVLGAPRHQDVPGWLIPSLFFDFIRDKNPAPLKGVLEHNRRDLLAMVALCSHLKKVLTCQEVDDPYLSLGLGRLWAVLGESERSDLFFERAIKDRTLGEEAREKALVFWARELKRRDLGPKAAMLWRRTLIHYPGNLEATVELAKWLEHSQGDYRSALILVEGGLRDRTLTSRRRQELEHRATRLRRRMG
ncbi:MAG: ribonuclease H-like domain-containing protein, partial [Candidatus Eremiobacteraeota bacterium]|nr:ribonuclease H-like domain-containing protein [Candidatus Eremiobacteraeota bacterium]